MKNYIKMDETRACSTRVQKQKSIGLVRTYECVKYLSVGSGEKLASLTRKVVISTSRAWKLPQQSYCRDDIGKNLTAVVSVLTITVYASIGI